MVRFLIGLLFIFSINANAITVSGAGAGTITVAGNVLLTSTTIILKTSIFSGSRSSLYRADGTTRGVYQVTTGKTFIVDAVCYDQATTAGTAAGNQLRYADNSVAGVNLTTAMTNVVGMISGVTNANEADTYATTAVIGYHCVQPGGSAPANKFPYVELVGSHDEVFVYGHEI